MRVTVRAHARRYSVFLSSPYCSVRGSFVNAIKEFGSPDTAVDFGVCACDMRIGRNCHRPGCRPFAGLIEANDGNFYGVTAHGGSSNKGVLFRMTPDGVLTVLHNFTRGSDGARPMGGLVQASDGNLYGTGKYGGKNGVGVLFRAALSGDVVRLHDFDYSTGAVPEALLQHTNGIVYGTTLDGGVGAAAGTARSTASILACRRS